MAPAIAARLLLAVAFALIAIVAVPATSPAAAQRKRAAQCTDAQAAPTAANLAVVRAAVLCLHNRERAVRGLPALKENAKLRQAAEGHSADMVGSGYFAHETPGGADMTDRILRTGYARGAGWSLGENIAYGTAELATAAQIHRAWMHSPGHRANILRREYREIGIGIALGAPVDTGGYDGATYTTDFGVRR